MLKTKSKSRGSQGFDVLPDMTPMLDIIFMLLVFFILTSGVTFRSLELALPSTTDPNLAAAKEDNSVLLQINQANFVIDDNDIDNIDALGVYIDEMSQHRSDAELVIACDKGVPVQRFLDVLTLITKKKIAIAKILMETKQQQP